MLTLGWSDGNSFLGIDFTLLSSANKNNRYNEINPDVDRRSCGYKRRSEAITKTTEHLVPMVKRALSIGNGLINDLLENCSEHVMKKWSIYHSLNP